MRPGMVTHQVNTEQRAVPLNFTTPSPREYVVQAPATSAEAPPGYYMLFALTSDGVPSKAVWIRLLS